MIKHENEKGNICYNYKNISLNALKKIPKKEQLSFENRKNKLNSKINLYNNSSCGNRNKNVKYLNYRKKLLTKCNSQILNNKILPILTNKHKNNNSNSNKVAFSLGDKSIFQKIPTIKSPRLLEKDNNSQIKKIKIPYLSHSLNKNINIKNQNGILKIENKNKDIYHTINSTKHLNINNVNKLSINEIDEKKNINTKKKESTSNLKNTEDNNQNININHNENEENELKENINISDNNHNNNNIDKLSKDLIPKKRNYKYKPYKFSKFFKISKNRNVSARNIYEHYISEDLKENDINDPRDNFTKFVEKKYKNPFKKFDELFGINKPYLVRLQEIKNNNSIAFKDDFNLQEYQNILCGMIRKRVRNDNIYVLKEDYKKFNEKLNRGYLSYKGRFSQLAEKIRYNAPSYLIDKLKKLDEDKLKIKARYFKINLNKKKNNDEDYAIEDFDYYCENKFVPNSDINKF